MQIPLQNLVIDQVTYKKYAIPSQTIQSLSPLKWNWLQ